MQITKNQTADKLEVALSGRLDTNTAPQLEQDMASALAGVKDLVFDFTDLAYVSSAGLRVLLALQKTMNKQGSMKVTHVNPEIMEIFEITGFLDVLTVE